MTEYVRIYLDLTSDPKFATVYADDHHFSTWVRLLMAADALWPAAAPVPRTVSEVSLAVLVDVGLVELAPNDHYRIHGLDTERQRRSEVGRIGGLASGLARQRTSVERPLNERRTKTNTQSRAEQSKAEPSRASRARATTTPTRIDGRTTTEMTCPDCGDLLSDKDTNVVRDGRGQFWHRQCPPAVSA